jgi:hypothetical protein
MIAQVFHSRALTLPAHAEGCSHVRVTRTHRFRVVPALGVSAASDDARRVLGLGLGLPLVDEDECSLSFGLGKLAVFVDTSGIDGGAPGFLPMLAIDDLAWAIERFESLGCTTSPMPWAPENPGVLVRGPGALTFCVVPEEQVVGARAQRYVDETSEVEREIPRQVSGIFSRADVPDVPKK